MSGIILIQDTDNQTGAFQLENQWHEKGEQELNVLCFFLNTRTLASIKQAK